MLDDMYMARLEKPLPSIIDSAREATPKHVGSILDQLAAAHSKRKK